MRLSRAWSAAAALTIAGCGSGAGTAPHAPSVAVRGPTTLAQTTASAPKSAHKPALPAYPQITDAATSTNATSFVPAVLIGGRPAAWIARTGSGLTLLSFDQRLVELRLHSGTADPGGSGWRVGPVLAAGERRGLAAAFNGAFKLSTGAGGYESFGRVAAPVRAGLGSVVTYSDGSTDIGAWGREVPAAGHAVVSVRQNLSPLIDHGTPASTLDCRACWGKTLGAVDDPARAALGVTADGRLIWAAGEHMTVRALANALLGARVVRAVELDINPEWVAGYLYGHHGDGGLLTPVPALPTQHGIPGEFLTPWSRDFFTIVAR